MAWAPPRHHHLNEPSPPTTITLQGSGPNDVSDHINIDANMVIILSVLLFALLCALGLNSFVRCALRYCSNWHRNHHREVGPIIGPYTGTLNRGLKRSTIRQIPTTNYQMDSSGTTRVNNIVMSTDCMVCLGEFIEGEKIKVLPKCNHGFHTKCIDTWLLSNSTCPTCRHSLSGWVGNGAVVVSMTMANQGVQSH
ncbi:RING-H2 finger protein ATL74-like [Amaranthus tricolor]|uniref:RING-H2 finger protein ATL74-like n=1 Tax=Amaranthus tricolor TaxID=29722 RepID=UPI00258A01F5|nr:RING-H2 finger protein ATL74-like [Amaranthus tricolor]